MQHRIDLASLWRHSDCHYTVHLLTALLPALLPADLLILDSRMTPRRDSVPRLTAVNGAYPKTAHPPTHSVSVSMMLGLVLW